MKNTFFVKIIFFSSLILLTVFLTFAKSALAAPMQWPSFQGFNGENQFFNCRGNSGNTGGTGGNGGSSVNFPGSSECLEINPKVPNLVAVNLVNTSIVSLNWTQNPASYDYSSLYGNSSKNYLALFSLSYDFLLKKTN